MIGGTITMRRAIGSLLLPASLMLCAAPQWAGAAETSPSQSFMVQGLVPTRCKISAPLASTGSNASLGVSTNGSELDLTALVDATSAKTLASQITIQFPIVCSGAQSLTISTQQGGLNNQEAAGASGGFQTHANYVLNVSWGGLSQSLTTSGSAATLDLSQSDPASGNLTINFNLPSGQGPLQAGTYADAIVVQLNAQ